MIDNLYELDEKVNKVVNYIVAQSTQKTTDGTCTISYDDVEKLISFEDYLQFFNFIASELAGRPEVRDLDAHDDEFCTTFDPNYCPNYQWSMGDEVIFGMSKEEWEATFVAKPVTQALSMSRMAQIGQAAIDDTMENAEMAVDFLTESLGMSMAEVEQLHLFDPPEIRTMEEYRAAYGEPELNYEVVDVQKNSVTRFQEFDQALAAYKDLGKSNLKSISAIIPQGMVHEGAVVILQEQGGKDKLCNTNMDLPHIKAVRDIFKGTHVDEAFHTAAQYVESQSHSIQFFVGSSRLPAEKANFDTFEDALKAYSELGHTAKAIMCITDNDPRTAQTLVDYNTSMHFSYPGKVSKKALENPRVAMYHAKAILMCHPMDEKAWDLLDKSEKALGIFERRVDTSKDLHVGRWRVHVVRPGERYGRHNQLIHDKQDPLVLFYDTKHKDPKYAPEGQKASSYSMDTLLGRDGWNSGTYPAGLKLDASVPEWFVTASEMQTVIRYLKDFEISQNKQPSLNDRINRAESQKTAPTMHEAPKPPERG